MSVDALVGAFIPCRRQRGCDTLHEQRAGVRHIGMANRACVSGFHKHRSIIVTNVHVLTSLTHARKCVHHCTTVSPISLLTMNFQCHSSTIATTAVSNETCVRPNIFIAQLDNLQKELNLYK